MAAFGPGVCAATAAAIRAAPRASANRRLVVVLVGKLMDVPPGAWAAPLAPLLHRPAPRRLPGPRPTRFPPPTVNQWTDRRQAAVGGDDGHGAGSPECDVDL